MAYPFILHERAHEEYIAAYEWYELQQKDLGKRFMSSIEKRLQQISEHPEYYGKRKGNYRSAKVENFPYMIVYEFFGRKQLIHVVAIYHGKRNPGNKYRRIK